MIFNAFMRDWTSTRAQIRWLLPTVAALAFCVVVQTVALLGQDEVVVLVPPDLMSETEVGTSSAGDDYIKSWGLHIATLIGNVTPGSGGFIKESIYPLLDPGIHDEVTRIIERQLDQLERERVALRFEPRRVVQKSNRVFVFGYGVTSAVGGEEKERTKRTYEIELEIHRHRPVIRSMQTYADEPRVDARSVVTSLSRA